MLFRQKVKSPFIKLKPETPYLSPEGRDLILILGRTGSGQSTFANYMAGVQMEMNSEDSLKLKPGQHNTCKAGYSAESITAFPQVVSTDKGVDLLDCRGLDAVFQSPKDEASTFANQHAILQAKSIQGIAIVIDCPRIERLQLNGLTELLEKTISNFYQQKDSMMFFVSQTPKDVTFDDILEKLKERADNEIKNEPGKTSKQMFYHLIKNHPEKLHFFDPTDISKREFIAAQLKALKPLPKENFNFPGAFKACTKVYQGIESLRENLDELIKSKEDLINEKNKPKTDENENIDSYLERMELLINECSELIKLKSLFISMMIKTDDNSVNQYKIAYKKYIERETHTQDFDDAREDIMFDRFDFLMTKSLDRLQSAIKILVEQSKVLNETPEAQDKNDSVEEKRAFSP